MESTNSVVACALAARVKLGLPRSAAPSVPVTCEEAVERPWIAVKFAKVGTINADSVLVRTSIL